MLSPALGLASRFLSRPSHGSLLSHELCLVSMAASTWLLNLAMSDCGALLIFSPQLRPSFRIISRRRFRIGLTFQGRSRERIILTLDPPIATPSKRQRSEYRRGECQRQRIGNIRRAETASPHIFFAFEDDPLRIS